MSSEPPPTPTGEEIAQLDGLDVLTDSDFDSLKLLSRALHVKDADLTETLKAILRSATTVIAGADHAGVNLLFHGRFEPQACTGGPPRELDALQQRTESGPCIDAAKEQRTIHVSDMAADDRWPEFRSSALDLGVHAMLCVPLWAGDDHFGSLSLYGDAPDCFNAATKQLADLYATYAALALAEARRTDQLKRAILSRDVIGQAKGILMERHRISAEEAFDQLREVSQRLNRKITDVAEQLTSAGEFPSR